MVKVNIQAHMQTTFGGGYFRPRVILALFETYSQRLQGGGGAAPHLSLGTASCQYSAMFM